MTTTERMMQMLNGFQVSQVLHVAAVLRLSDHLSDGGKTLDELATATGCHSRSLGRLMRALTALGVYDEQGGTFVSIELGDSLRSDAPDSVPSRAAFIGEPSFWRAWGGLLHSVQTGENAFEWIHGMSDWQYRAERPEAERVFDTFMTTQTAAVLPAVVSSYDFGRFDTVVDVGGGRGGLLAGILHKHPNVRGVLFDQPQVAAGARDALAAGGVSDRVEVVGGSFFDGVPGADCYVLKSILHDWDDARARQILTSCRAAMATDGVVLLVEQLLDDPRWALALAMTDLTMLVGPGGAERSEGEFAALLENGGLALSRVIRTDSRFSIIEAVPA